MWFFKSKPKPAIIKQKNYYFANNSNYNDKFQLNENELKFFDILSERTIGWNKGIFRLERMGDGTISVWLPEGFVGKIRLCKKKHWMMILKNLYDNEIVEGTVDDFIKNIDAWIRYCKKYL